MLRTLLVEEAKLLTFRSPGPAIQQHWKAFFVFGLVCTWLAGIGRYWDHPRAEVWQRLGLGSLAYVVVFAAILWLLILPLKPRHWSYRNVLLFVTLTSPPALLYAIPVERFMSMDAAGTLNVGFLAVVATWRVALLFQFFRRVAGLDWWLVAVASLLPLALIVVALTVLNLEHVVFQIMAGNDPGQSSSGDASYFVLFLISGLAYALSPILLFVYGVAVFIARKDRVKHVD